MRSTAKLVCGSFVRIGKFDEVYEVIEILKYCNFKLKDVKSGEELEAHIRLLIEVKEEGVKKKVNLEDYDDVL